MTVIVMIGCSGPESFYRDAGGPLTGLGGAPGEGGAPGGGGSGMGGAGGGTGGNTGAGGAGLGGAPGVGGRTGAGGSGSGGAPAAGGRTGSGGSSLGGAPGVGGRGVGGSGVGGSGAGGSGAGGMTAAGGVTGAGGLTGVGGGGCAGVYCDNFEADTVGAVAAAWLRAGGSEGDWAVRADTTKVFAQDNATSATFRAAYSMSAPGAPWSGATTVSAQVKPLANGSSGTTTALLCLRYTTSNAAYCLALMPAMGAQIQSRNGGVISTMSALFPVTISLGTTYSAQLSISAAGVLSASLNGAALGSFTPTDAIASGYVAVATQAAEASFDNVIVTQP